MKKFKKIEFNHNDHKTMEYASTGFRMAALAVGGAGLAVIAKKAGGKGGMKALTSLSKFIFHV